MGKKPRMDTNKHESGGTTEYTENTEMGKIIPPGGEVLIYKTDDGQAKVDVRLLNESLWSTQSDMALLFQCSADNISLFFSIIQNKLHYAVTGLTAAELIQQRTNHQLPNMGLTSWKSEVVRKADVVTAKNYLKEDEIDGLNLIVGMWLDYAEQQAKRRQQVFMKDWQEKLNAFLEFNEYNILQNAGNISKKQADNHARKEYEQFESKRRDYIESQAEEEYIKDLEQAAKQLPAKNIGGDHE